LDVLDLSLGSPPVRVGRYEGEIWPRDVAVAGDIACVVSSGGMQMQTLDIRDPAHPKFLGRCETPFFCERVMISGHYAFVSALNHGLRIIDLANPASPQPLGQWDSTHSVMQTAVAGNYAYVADMDGGLQVLDITNPRLPRLVSNYQDGMWPVEGVAVSGRTAYLVGSQGLCALDVSNPAQPRRVASATGFSGVTVAVGEHTLCVCSPLDGLLIFDRYEPPPELTGRADGTGYRLTVKGEAEQTLVLERSEDLKHWTDWLGLVASGEAQEILDPIAGKVSGQYYRARLQSSGEAGTRLSEGGTGAF
jgi:hypothetical protein